MINDLQGMRELVSSQVSVEGPSEAPDQLTDQHLEAIDGRLHRLEEVIKQLEQKDTVRITPRGTSEFRELLAGWGRIEQIVAKQPKTIMAVQAKDTYPGRAL